MASYRTGFSWLMKYTSLLFLVLHKNSKANTNEWKTVLEVNVSDKWCVENYKIKGDNLSMKGNPTVIYHSMGKESSRNVKPFPSGKRYEIWKKTAVPSRNFGYRLAASHCRCVLCSWIMFKKYRMVTKTLNNSPRVVHENRLPLQGDVIYVWYSNSDSCACTNSTSAGSTLNKLCVHFLIEPPSLTSRTKDFGQRRPQEGSTSTIGQ